MRAELSATGCRAYTGNVVPRCCGQPMERIHDENGHATAHMMCGPCGRTAMETFGTLIMDLGAL